MVPVYMAQLGLIGKLGESTSKMLSSTSFGIMIFALAVGAFIVLRSMWVGRREERQAELQLAPIKSYETF
jgi:hypothetical protein